VQVKDLLKQQPVDVVVFSGSAPPRDEGFWTAEHLKCVVWVTERRPNKAVAPGEGWITTYRRVSHNSVGGVTNKGAWAGIATRRKRGLVWQPGEKVVENVLRQVVNPTVGGRYACPINENTRNTTNTAEGLLDWERRFDWVKVPTVFSKTKWVSRKLNPKELCNALDIPGSLSEGVTEEGKKLLSKLPIPGKIYQFLFQGIRKGSHWNESSRVPGGSCKQKESCVQEHPEELLPQFPKRRKEMVGLGAGHKERAASEENKGGRD